VSTRWSWGQMVAALAGATFSHMPRVRGEGQHRAHPEHTKPLQPRRTDSRLGVSPSQRPFVVVELRGLEPLTFSLRRLLLVEDVLSASVQAVASDAWRPVPLRLGSTQGAHAFSAWEDVRAAQIRTD
jgi:hypothetical protein